MIRLLVLTLPLLLAFACGSSPEGAPPPSELQTPRQVLAYAEAQLEAGNPARARALLEERDANEFTGIERERYLVALADAQFATESYWAAFATLRDFPRLYPLSVYLPRAEWLTYRAGAELAASGWTVLGIVSDLDDAIVVLDHFLIYFPRSRYTLDAYRILGEAAYLDRDYQGAIQRYEELRQRVTQREEADRVWIDLAGHRIAMSYFRMCQGPDYDAEGLERAQAELVGYLESGSTNAEFVDEARASLTTVLQWIEEKRLRIARYYLTIEKPKGARRQLEALLADPQSQRQDEARELLATVEALEREQSLREAKDLQR